MKSKHASVWGSLAGLSTIWTRVRPWPLRYGVAFLAVVAAVAALALPVIGKGLGLVLFLAILIGAWYGGLGPGLMATGLIVAIALVSEQVLGDGLSLVQVVNLVLFVAGGVLVTLLVEALHSARRRAEAAAAAAEEANRAKDRFLAVLSHELRTPLTPVLLAVTDLLDRAGVPVELRPTLELARRHIELEARLIDDLLDTTRITRGRLELERAVVDVHDLVRRAVETTRQELRTGGLELTLDLAATAHHVEGDEARLQQVLWNLLKNAMKFTPEGGALTVRTRNAGTANDGDTTGRSLLVEVADTGIGIAPETISRIFDAFEPGDASAWSRRAGGLGLGLAIGKAIAEAHGGRLKAASEGPGRGATFTLELESAAAPSATAPRPAFEGRVESPNRPGMTILLVEDDEPTLAILARLLRLRGYNVLTARTVAEALQVADDDSFDLVVSDLGLPDGDGLEMLRMMRSRRDVAAIALSGFGMEEDVRRAQQAGFRAHLTKPVDLPKLEAAIRRVGAPSILTPQS